MSFISDLAGIFGLKSPNAFNNMSLAGAPPIKGVNESPEAYQARLLAWSDKAGANMAMMNAIQSLISKYFGR